MWAHLLVLLLPFLYVASCDKSVVVTLNAKWRPTSYLAETSEFFARESNGSFWRFVDRVVENVDVAAWKSASTQQRYEIAIREARRLLPGSRVGLLKLSLATRVNSPGVQLFQQLAEEAGAPDCDAFFVYGPTTGCTVDDLEKALSAGSKDASVAILSNDHVYPSGSVDLPALIVYGDLGSAEWRTLHLSARRAAKDGRVVYLFRHFSRGSLNGEDRLPLSGFGVELAIKNTEYKAVDDSNDDASNDEEKPIGGFNFKTLKQLHSHIHTELDKFKTHMKDKEGLSTLKQWQVQDLSVQAAQKVLRAGVDGALATIKQLATDFPLFATTIAQEQVSSELRAELEANTESLAESEVGVGESMLFINGIPVDIDSTDVFQLLTTLDSELKLAQALHDLGINREYLSLLVGMNFATEKLSYALDYRQAAPQFLNDLDRDKEYKQWGNSVKLMLQPYYPGMIRPIARNFFTLVFILDPADKASWPLVKIGLSFFQHEIPIRIGYSWIVPSGENVDGQSSTSLALLNLFNYAVVEKDVRTAVRLLVKLFDANRGADKIEPATVHAFFKKEFSDGDVADVFGPTSDYDKGKLVGTEFVQRSGLGDGPQVLLNGVPLDREGVLSDRFEETVIQEVARATPTIQKAVMAGRLTDGDNVAAWLLSQPEVVFRMNRRVLDAPTKAEFVLLDKSAECNVKTVVDFERLPSEAEQSNCIAKRLKYLRRTDEEATRPVSLWVVADIEDAPGRELLYNHIRHLKGSHLSRVAWLANPTNVEAACKVDSLSMLIHAALRLLPSQQAKQLATKLLKEEHIAQFLAGTQSVADLIEQLAPHGMDVAAFHRERKTLGCDRIRTESIFATDPRGSVRVAPGQRLVVANGLRVGPLDEKEAFLEEDVALLEKIIISRGAKVVADHLDNWKKPQRHDESSELALRIASVIGRVAVKRRRIWVTLTDDKHSSLNLPAPDQSSPILDVLAVVEPLSRQAQKLAPLLELIRGGVNADLKIVMNPRQKLSELPLKRYYRYVVESEPHFDNDGEQVAPKAIFSDLPAQQLLTLSLQAPDSWLVEPVYALYDLDNILMGKVAGDIVAAFSLETILLEGHCFDEVTGMPPRGLQFILGTDRRPVVHDTIVMANLGYFQLKALPGAWLLRVREGRSSDIYRIHSHTNTEPSSTLDTVRVVIDSFSGRTIRVKVAKRPGMEDEQLLANDAGGPGGDDSIWSSVSSALGGGDQHEEINIFSLASGHLYERLLRIMILSVIKNTKHPVKFWLLRNYLSPQFKESLPILAETYKFRFELVEYKWPRWLHAQTEKQRVMWGYKILFLDVLFPLDVKRIIFVDADQVVRVDMLELMNFDLGGAPYGFTPFCESRESMEGFRFWKKGYWATHLAGRKYHISALYTVDLAKFRQIAAGDRLRGQYQGLSADPNSLSNLDQDLPNNMIHQVKIKSLPQEWLYCETWCADEDKAKAKTIDLCNNPLTKESKLSAAVRIIAEWKDYDEEIKRVLANETIRTGGGGGGKQADASHTEL